MAKIEEGNQKDLTDVLVEEPPGGTSGPLPPPGLPTSPRKAKKKWRRKARKHACTATQVVLPTTSRKRALIAAPVILTITSAMATGNLRGGLAKASSISALLSFAGALAMLVLSVKHQKPPKRVARRLDWLMWIAISFMMIALLLYVLGGLLV